jgi:hypothetical protein
MQTRRISVMVKKVTKQKTAETYELSAKDIAGAIEYFLDPICRTDSNNGVKLCFDIEWEDFPILKNSSFESAKTGLNMTRWDEYKIGSDIVAAIQKELYHEDFGRYMDSWKAHKVVSIIDASDEFLMFHVELIINGFDVKKGPAVIVTDTTEPVK